MKVIKHGNTYKEIECTKCGALLSYCENDLKLSYNEVFDYSWETKYIICPECKYKIILQTIEY